MQEDIRGGLLKYENTEEPLIHLGQALTRYDQIADGFVYLNNKEKDYEIVNELKISWVDNFLAEILRPQTQTRLKTQTKILIFSKFIASRKLIYNFLVNEGLFNRSDDITQCFLYEKDYQAIEDFKKSTSQLSILISSQKLMSTGFNLQDANIVIFYSNDGDFASKEQAIGRVARQGQQKEVFIYDLVINSSFKTETIEKIIAFTQDKSSADERALKRLLTKEKKLESLKNYFTNNN